MKCNVDKINEFFNGDKFDKDIKKFVMKLFKEFFELKNSYFDEDEARICFLCLDFYSVEKDDDLNDENYKVIDFYTISLLAPKFKKYILELLLKYIKNKSDINTDFVNEFMLEDIKILIPYEKWFKINRKNKLKKLDKNGNTTNNIP